MRIIKHICFLIIVLVVFTILLSCSNERQEINSNLATNQNTRISNSNTNQFDVAEFERNRELWTSRNIENYKMIVGAQGFLMNFPEQVLVEVQNRQAKSIKSLSGRNNNATQTYKEYDTIEKLFNLVEREKKKNAEKLYVKYDETLGYPAQIIIDERSDWADDELSITVKNLEVIKKFENQL